MALVAALPFVVQGQQKRTAAKKPATTAKAPAKRRVTSKTTSGKRKTTAS